jgi:hypothetical protein
MRISGFLAAPDDSLIGGRAHASDPVEKRGILREKRLHYEPVKIWIFLSQWLEHPWRSTLLIAMCCVKNMQCREEKLPDNLS